MNQTAKGSRAASTTATTTDTAEGSEAQETGSPEGDTPAKGGPLGGAEAAGQKPIVLGIRFPAKGPAATPVVANAPAKDAKHGDVKSAKTDDGSTDAVPEAASNASGTLRVPIQLSGGRTGLQAAESAEPPAAEEKSTKVPAGSVVAFVAVPQMIPVVAVPAAEAGTGSAEGASGPTLPVKAVKASGEDEVASPAAAVQLIIRTAAQVPVDSPTVAVASDSSAAMASPRAGLTRPELPGAIKDEDASPERGVGEASAKSSMTAATADKESTANASVLRTSAAHPAESGPQERHAGGKKQDGAAIVAAEVPVARGSAESQGGPAGNAPGGPGRDVEMRQTLPHREGTAPAPPPAPAAAPEAMAPEALPKAPLRSMSLEFSPDGAGEVHLKLSERAGEVHVSLHTTDASLNHQLRNGMGDLATVLAGAGYDAEAWTSPDRGGRQQREQQRVPEPQQQKAGGAFDTLINHSELEVI